MKKVFFLSILFVLVCACVSTPQSQEKTKQFPFGLKTINITTPNSKQITLALAQTPKDQELGLMGVEKLDKDKGMLFVFSKPEIQSFWMKNTRIPLDLVYINENLTVTQVQTMQPCYTSSCPSYLSNSKVLYAIELNAGAANEFGFIPGAKINTQKPF